MIVEMRKVFVATRAPDREKCLDALRDFGAIHLVPVDPAQAVPDEQTTTALAQIVRALQVLANVAPAGERPDLSPTAAAQELADLERKTTEWNTRLSTLHRQIDALEVWGDVRREQFEQLRARGVEIRFYLLPAERTGEVRADLVAPIREVPDGRLLLAAASRGGEIAAPEDAEPLELPSRDRPALRAEAHQVHADLRRASERLEQIAWLIPQMRTERDRLAEHAQFTVAQRGALQRESLFALQGWVPVRSADGLAESLRRRGLDAAVAAIPPAEGEEPPTLIEYPRWARPIKALFDMLGTLPGYREIDLAPFFMIALPLFAGILIGDAGYGILFIVLSLVFRRRLLESVGPAAANLLLVIGGFTLGWGMLTANYFGVTPEGLTGSGWAPLRRLMLAPALLYAEGQAGQDLIMLTAIIIGTVHLSLAQLRRALAQYPDPRFIASVGWAVFLWGMFLLVRGLLFGGVGAIPWNYVVPLLGIGYALVLGFSYPDRGLIGRVVLGFAGSLLPILSTFSDTMSYIRLMAVGLASLYIAAAFNDLGSQVAASATWFAGAPIVIFGHLLNIGLAVIAVFAHGVRLNMLEFSSNAGVQWAGYAFQPFARAQRKEI